MTRRIITNHPEGWHDAMAKKVVSRKEGAPSEYCISKPNYTFKDGWYPCCGYFYITEIDFYQS